MSLVWPDVILSGHCSLWLSCYPSSLGASLGSGPAQASAPHSPYKLPFFRIGAGRNLTLLPCMSRGSSPVHKTLLSNHIVTMVGPQFTLYGVCQDLVGVCLHKLQFTPEGAVASQDCISLPSMMTWAPCPTYSPSKHNCGLECFKDARPCVSSTWVCQSVVLHVRTDACRTAASWKQALSRSSCRQILTG